MIQVWKSHNRITKDTAMIDCLNSEEFNFEDVNHAIAFILEDANEGTNYQLLYLVEEPETLNSIALLHSTILNVICDDYLKDGKLNKDKIKDFLVDKLKSAYEDDQ